MNTVKLFNSYKRCCKKKVQAGGLNTLPLSVFVSRAERNYKKSEYFKIIARYFSTFHHTSRCVNQLCYTYKIHTTKLDFYLMSTKIKQCKWCKYKNKNMLQL